MMPVPEDVVIVGAGLAGASAARALRDEGFRGRIRMIGAETHRPYLRPPLSKDFLAGSSDAESLDVEPASWYVENHVELVLGRRVTRLDALDHSVRMDDGASLHYDRILLATGCRPRELGVPGSEGTRVHYLRTVEDSERLRAALTGGGARVVIVGSGWIGMEIAASATVLGNEVTVIGRDEIPLSGALGNELGAMFADLHAEHGVHVVAPASVQAVVEEGGALVVQLGDGRRLSADVIVAGVGAAPRTELAEAAGARIDNGVLVDSALRASVPDVFAAGDIANAFHPVLGAHLRSEHWANAINSGKAAARSMLGQDVVYDEIPYFYTDQFDVGMEYSGYGPLARGADVAYRGDLAGREFIVFWVADGRVVAGMNVNVWDVQDDIRALIRRDGTVDVRRLADPAVALADV